MMCDKIIESYDEDANAEAKSNDKAKLYNETNFNEKKATWKTQNFDVLLPFLLIATALLTAVSIYCYLIKYLAKHYHFPTPIMN